MPHKGSFTKQEAISRFGKEIVDLAESYYETMPDKWFFEDLSREEQLDYFSRAGYHLKREEQEKKSTNLESCFQNISARFDHEMQGVHDKKGCQIVPLFLDHLLLDSCSVEVQKALYVALQKHFSNHHTEK